MNRALFESYRARRRTHGARATRKRIAPFERHLQHGVGTNEQHGQHTNVAMPRLGARREQTGAFFGTRNIFYHHAPSMVHPAHAQYLYYLQNLFLLFTVIARRGPRVRRRLNHAVPILRKPEPSHRV